jgi:superfamily II DNA/RNA helicase
VNLQNANLMVNYDLPWNPNRLEQRFGRIHRIGQTEVCHLWNMVASETREGDVFQRLFEKLEVEREALGGRVFDILGEVFEDRSLKDLLIDAIRYGADPEVRARLLRKVEGALDTQHLEDIIKRNALCEEVMDEKRLFAVKEEMEKAEARKLQPYFIRSFFTQAFQQLGGELRPRAGPLRDHQRPGHHPRARPPDHRARPAQCRPCAAPLRARLLREAVRPRADRGARRWPACMHPATR